MTATSAVPGGPAGVQLPPSVQLPLTPFQVRAAAGPTEARLSAAAHSGHEPKNDRRGEFMPASSRGDCRRDGLVIVGTQSRFASCGDSERGAKRSRAHAGRQCAPGSYARELRACFTETRLGQLPSFAQRRLAPTRSSSERAWESASAQSGLNPGHPSNSFTTCARPIRYERRGDPLVLCDGSKPVPDSLRSSGLQENADVFVAHQMSASESGVRLFTAYGA